MKEEWKVYIKGVPNRGDEIIKILTNLGANNDYNCDGYASNYFIYFINHKGYISAASINSEPAKIIMDNYTELHLPEKWKDGDILVDNDDPNRFAVKMNVWNDGNFKAYLFVNQKFIQERPIVTFCDKNYHKADSEEVRQFYELLHKYGKDWDAEKKQLVDLRWEPKDNERYYYILSDVTVHSCAWLDDNTDNSRFSIGNCFKTEEEAEAIAEKLKKLLKD